MTLCESPWDTLYIFKYTSQLGFYPGPPIQYFITYSMSHRGDDNSRMSPRDPLCTCSCSVWSYVEVRSVSCRRHYLHHTWLYVKRSNTQKSYDPRNIHNARMKHGQHVIRCHFKSIQIRITSWDLKLFPSIQSSVETSTRMTKSLDALSLPFVIIFFVIRMH